MVWDGRGWPAERRAAVPGVQSEVQHVVQAAVLHIIALPRRTMETVNPCAPAVWRVIKQRALVADKNIRKPFYRKALP